MSWQSRWEELRSTVERESRWAQDRVKHPNASDFEAVRAQGESTALGWVSKWMSEMEERDGARSGVRVEQGDTGIRVSMPHRHEWSPTVAGVERCECGAAREVNP